MKEAKVSQKQKNPIQRFWEKVEQTDTCWVWTAGERKPGGGYGSLRVAGKNFPAHRFGWELANGPVPEGKILCHHCDNPRCVRPDHLYPGTMRDNIDDMIRRGRKPSGDVLRAALKKARERPKPLKKAPATVDERFASKLDKAAGAEACWRWLASYSKGRPQFSVRLGKTVLAQSYAWASVHGPLPEGMIAEGVCGWRHCMNPAHLGLVRSQQRKRSTSASPPGDK